MRLSLSRHKVLVTVPVSQAALERLDVFFDVDQQRVDDPDDREAMLKLLADKAGALVDARVVIDGPLVQLLPMLRAVSVIEANHHRLDLDALTNAGIRATNVPTSPPTNVEDLVGLVDPSADRVAVEGLVASLGFGRRSFHPPWLLNPEVSCTSCC